MKYMYTRFRNTGTGNCIYDTSITVDFSISFPNFSFVYILLDYVHRHDSGHWGIGVALLKEGLLSVDFEIPPFHLPF